MTRSVGTKTLEMLECDVWPVPDYPSRLVKKAHALRKTPLDDFTVEDLRLMIGQSIGLQYLLPRAMAVLANDPLAEGDFYPGDLLVQVVKISPRPQLAPLCARALADPRQQFSKEDYARLTNLL